jgi:hypothetical protein
MNGDNSSCGGVDALTSLRLHYRSLRICSVGAPRHRIHRAHNLNCPSSSTGSWSPPWLNLASNSQSQTGQTHEEHARGWARVWHTFIRSECRVTEERSWFWLSRSYVAVFA